MEKNEEIKGKLSSENKEEEPKELTSEELDGVAGGRPGRQKQGVISNLPPPIQLPPLPFNNK